MAGTSTAVAAAPNASVCGQAVTLTATVSVVSPGSNAVASPTGTVTFYANGTSIGTGTLGIVNDQDQATFTTSALSTGSDAITAAYTSGDGNFSASPVSASVTQVVNMAETSTAVASAPNPSVSGQPVTFTATVGVVGPGSTAVASPTGTVTFYDSGTPIGTGMLSVVSGQDEATFTTSTLSTASHSITAAYTSGDGNFNASSPSSAISQTVNEASTSAVGCDVRQFVGLRPGRDLYRNGGRRRSRQHGGRRSDRHGHFLRQRYTDRDRHAERRQRPGRGDIHHQHAEHSQSFDHRGLHQRRWQLQRESPSSAISQVVNKASTSATVATSLSPSVSGESVTFTATISVVGPGSTAVAYPTGTVTFYNNGTSIGTGVLSIVNGQDEATYTTSALATGTDSITATYTSGDGNFNASPASRDQPGRQQGQHEHIGCDVRQFVGLRPDRDLQGDNQRRGPRQHGRRLSHRDRDLLRQRNIDRHRHAVRRQRPRCGDVFNQHAGHGQPFDHRGLHERRWQLQREPRLEAISQVVNKASTSSTVASSGNPSAYGQTVTFTATISVASPGSTAAAYPTGTVTFYDSGTSIGTGTLSVVSGQDVATFTTNALSTGTDSITATYTSGDSNFNASPVSAAPARSSTKMALRRPPRPHPVQRTWARPSPLPRPWRPTRPARALPPEPWTSTTPPPAPT